MVTMQKEEMLSKVMNELEHIPKDRYPQGMFRGVYYWMRLHRLKENNEEEKEKTLQEAIKWIKEKYPTFDPNFDKDFFRVV